MCQSDTCEIEKYERPRRAIVLDLVRPPSENGEDSDWRASLFVD